MLGTDLLALSAADTGRSLSVAFTGDDIVVVVPCVPVVEGFMRIQGGEHVRDPDADYILGRKSDIYVFTFP